MENIKIQRTQSILLELIPEGLSSLNDSRINSLSITSVDCKKGKYDADVYFDSSDYSKEEIKVIISILKKANGIIKSFCLSCTGWYKCPNFNFIPDKSLENSLKIEKLFEKIKKAKI